MTPTSFTVHWSAGGGTPAPVYITQYRIAGNIPWTPNPAGTTPQTFQTINNLQSNTLYDVRVQASNKVGTAFSNVVQQRTLSAVGIVSRDMVGSIEWTAAAAESAQGASLTSTAGSIIDATGAKWTLVSATGLQVDRNGVAAGTTSNVTLLLYWNHTIYEENSTSQWQKWNGTGWVATTDPRIVTPPSESPNNTVLTTTSGSIIDTTGVSWTLVSATGLEVAQNGVVDATTANTTALLYFGHAVYRQNSIGTWFKFAGGAWSPIPNDPRIQTILLGAANTIADSTGVVWGLATANGGTATRNSVLDATQTGITELAYVGTTMWRNVAATGLWWSWDDTNWNPSAGTAVSPLGPTRNPWDQPGANGSVWNTSIGAGATFGAGTDLDTIDISRGWNGTSYTAGPVGTVSVAPSYVGASANAQYTFTATKNGRTVGTDNGSTLAATLHVPTGSTSLGTLALFDPINQPARQYTFTGLPLPAPGLKLGQGPFTAPTGEWDDATGGNFGEDAETGLSGINAGAGLINSYDTDATRNPVYPKIQHGFAFTTDPHLLKANGTASQSPAPPPSPTGVFSIANGQIIAPNGSPFVIKGIAVKDQELGVAFTNAQCQPLRSVFPGVNLIRISCTAYNPPSAFEPYISWLTALGIVVTIEDHTGTALGYDGGAGVMYGGAMLTGQQGWYSTLANAYKTNPLVWFGTMNEPSNSPAGGTPGPSGYVSGTVTINHVQTYNTIRAAGSNTIIEMEQIGGGNDPWMGTNNPNGLYPPSAYAGMHNIIWGPHFYNWVTNNSTDINVSIAALNTRIGLCQQILTADGTAPVAIYEFGPATGLNFDPGGLQSAGAVIQLNSSIGLGAVAWAWGQFQGSNSTTDSNNNPIPPWGPQVAAWLSASSASESPQGALVTTVGPAITDSSGERFTLTTVAQIAVNGVADTTTSNATTILYWNHLVYHENVAGNWYSKPNAAAAWVGPLVDPRPAAPPAALTVNPNSWPARLQDAQSGATLYSGNLLVGETLAIPSATAMPGGLNANQQGLFWSMVNYPSIFRGLASGGFAYRCDQVADTSQWMTDARAVLPSLVALLRPMRNQHQAGQSFTAGPKNGPGVRSDIGPPALAGQTPNPNPTESAQGTVVTTQLGPAIVDASLEKFTITTGAQIAVNGVVDTTTANVTSLLYWNHLVYQENTSLNWYSKAVSTAAWVGPTTDPRVVAPAGTFSVSNGQIIGPNGHPFVPKGINIADAEMAGTITGAGGGPMTQLFPGINCVRVACYSYQIPSFYSTFVNFCTALGIVVLLENHQNFNADGSGAGNGGGANGVFFTNANNLLQPETAWYAAIAKAFGGNPYVWFGTNNEPPGPNTGQPLSGLSTWQQSTYNTIRTSGAPNNLILLELAGGGGLPIGWFGANGGLTASVYAPMHGVVWDWHQYGWMFNGASGSAQNSVVSQASIQSQQLGGVALLQQITSADGLIPVVGGECGDSTTGSPIDTSGQAVVNATIANVRTAVGGLSGAMWWEWNSAPAPGDRLVTNGALTSPYGASVAAFCATSF